MTVRWVSFARVSMQRPGHLVAVAAAGSDSTPTSLKGLSADYSAVVRRRCRVDAARSDEVVAYLRKLRLWKRYGGRQGELAKLGEGRELPLIELQDIWLSDTVLPSATGAVTDEVADELPQLAVSAGLVRPRNHTRSERGRAIATLYKDDLERVALGDPDVSLFRFVSASPPQAGDRPGAAAYLLYCLIEADGDFLLAAWSVQLEAGAEEFTRASFGAKLPVACRKLADRLSRARVLADRQLVGRLDALARHIDERTPATERTWGGGRPRDQVATLRLEPYVDFGLVGRRSRTDYEYSQTDPQRRFFATLADTTEMQPFVEGQLINTYLKALGVDPSPIDETEIWDRVEHAYNRLRSGLGYAPAKEVVLLAIATLLNEGGHGCFEVADGLAAIRRQQQRRPDWLRYGVSSTGEPTYIRLGTGRK